MIETLIAGGGIGGLAAALAATRAGCRVRLFEQSAQWSEAGAGIQLGPNASRLLRDWGLEQALAKVAASPEQLVVRSATNGAQLAALRLGSSFSKRYGAPYLTVHRADLHELLVQGATAAGADLQLARRITQMDQSQTVVRLQLEHGGEVAGDLLVGADGVWSQVRKRLLRDAAAQPTGHLAYRAVLSQAGLPLRLRSQDISVWLGPRLHVVAYPVRQGEWLNLVAVVEGYRDDSAQDWDLEAAGVDLHAALGTVCADLQALVHAPELWRLWSLHERAPLRSARQMASGRVALLGDAAHPMRPYLAQGAAMALEDSAELARMLAMVGERGIDVPTALRRYALARWQRCARVQRRAERNGRVFHATGLLRWGRDVSLRLLGERLLDMPWLYRELR